MFYKDKMSMRGAFLMLLFFLLDLLSKQYLIHSIQYGTSIPVIKGFFSIVHIHNRGVAFGFLANLSEFYRLVFLCGVSGVVLLIILYLILNGKNRNTVYIVSLSLVGGGALGNLFERVANGYVVDFLDFHIKNYHYPAFNLADSFITIGIIVLFLYRLKTAKKN
jgi:signal peptidase II